MVVAESKPASIPGDAPVGKAGLDALLHDARVTIEFENAHADCVFGFIAEYVAANIVLDHRVIQPAEPCAAQPPAQAAPPTPPSANPDASYVTDGHLPYIKLEDVELADALRALCRLLDLAYETTPGFIWVTSPRNIEMETWPLPSRGTGRSIDAALNKTLSIEFENEHISRIVEFLVDTSGVSFVIDARVIAPAPGEIPDAIPAEVPPADVVTTGMVPYIKLTNLTLHETLLALLRPLNLAYRAEDDFIHISSPEGLMAESYRNSSPNDYKVAPAASTDSPAPPDETHTEAPTSTTAKEKASARAYTLRRIVPWNDGTYRAEIETGKRLRYFAIGDAFGPFELRSIDPEKESIEVFDEVKKEAQVLVAES
jgi:hypothetical protein